jgi:tetratricopeptide (TPR) repeat protein
LATTLALAVVMLAAAYASEASADATEEAKRVYDDGVAHFKAGRYIEAADAFRRAVELKPSWKLYFNLGQSEAAAKRYGLALDAFEKYLVAGGDNVPTERREQVLAEIQRMRVLVGLVEVAASDGVTLEIDGVERGKTPITGAVRVAAGARKVVLRKGGEVLLERDFNFAGGMTTTISAEEEGPETPVEAPVAEPPDEPSQQPEQPLVEDDEGAPVLLIAGISCGVLGLGGIAVGSYGAYLGARDYEDYEGAVDAADWEAVDEFEDDVLPRDRALTGVGFGVGGALLAAGVVLIVIDRIGDDGEEPAAVTVLPAPGGLAVTF